MELHHLLERHYGVKIEDVLQDGVDLRYSSKGFLYTISNVTNWEQELLAELHKMSNHLMAKGDPSVSTFVSNKDGRFLMTVNEADYVVLKNNRIPSPASIRYGRKLARFHNRGQYMNENIQHASRIGQWKYLWEQRLEQLESLFHQIIRQHPEDSFEEMFVKSYPYYMGLAENAIQYIVDTEIDEQPQEVDSGTICHDRFHRKSWGDDLFIRNPLDWVFDHPGRDLAEWIRSTYWSHSRIYRQDIQTFLNEYQSLRSLSAFSWRLIYARLLFPLHYFECIEDYFLTTETQTKKQLEEQLDRAIRDATDYEHFLALFYEIANVPVRQYRIPLIAWLH
ncbi:spore coat protein YutH [Oikeobacillus pervagus]|uniref:Spore coat protein YutH n=1 Tax=Oikeobacillus pervagus TaxID=1325931 RepID=A0AAJ1T1X1_9BACI|nr:spore coat protein YutH [Oikeobacillus pervagus]MDQ0215171.1 spore coat protein YutH [Oikeobacillus pervagus]